MRSAAAATEPDFLSGGGEAGELIRAFPWSETALGQLRDWPPALRQFTAYILRSPAPMALWWRPELVQIHNDAYRQMLGDHWMVALGRTAAGVGDGGRESILGAVRQVLATGRARVLQDVPFVLRRESGTETAYFTLLHNPVPAGSGTGGVVTVVTNTTLLGLRLRQARHAAPPEPARDREVEFQALAAAGAEAVYRMNADWSEVHMLSRKHEPPSEGSRAADQAWLRDYVLPEEQAPVLRALAAAAENNSTFEFEHRIRRRDGTLGWMQSRAVPLYDPQGRVREWVGSATDISWRHELLDRQAVLVAELQHRTRNLLGVVRSIANQTIESCATLDDFQARFDGRLGALSRVQALLTQTSDRPITLAQLIRLELEALGASPERDTRVRIEGPEITLNHRSLQTLALALHELATNARKHGALSCPEGSLRVSWTVSQEDETRLTLDWRESGVGIAPGTASFGYGRELIERALPYTLKARTVFHLGAEGVQCRVDLPLQTTAEGVHHVA